MSQRARLVEQLTGLAMIAAGVGIAAVFGGGLLAFLWVDVARLVRGTADTGRLISTLLVGPIVGVAPALLGLVLARMGWRRWRPVADFGDEP